MGFWSGIKHALNSTLGTEEFQPLDKIILGSKGLVASDNLYVSLYSSNLTTKLLDVGYTADVLKMRWSGSIRLNISAIVFSVRTSYIDITVNGVNYGRFSVPVDSNGYEASLDIVGLKVGDVIGLTVSNNSCNLRKLFISADITDVSAFDILF